MQSAEYGVIIGIVSGIIGAIAAGAFLFFVVSNKLKRCTDEALATVIEIRRSAARRGNVNIAVFRVNGTEYTCYCRPGNEKHQIGDNVKVRYDPKNPHLCFEVSNADGMRVLMIIGAAFFAVGIVLALLALLYWFFIA